MIAGSSPGLSHWHEPFTGNMNSRIFSMHWYSLWILAQPKKKKKKDKTKLSHTGLSVLRQSQWQAILTVGHIRALSASSLSLKVASALLRTLCICIWILELACWFSQKTLLGHDWGCVKPMHEFKQNWHISNIEPSNLQMCYFPPLIST